MIFRRPERPRLAVAARSFSKPSETFIRAHATRLAPEHTVLISGEPDSAEEFEMPVLSGIDLGGTSRPDRIEDRWVRKFFPEAARRRRELGYVTPKSRRQILRFLRRNRVDTLLIEYGPVAARLTEVMARFGGRSFIHFHGYDASRLLLEEKFLAKYDRLRDLAAGVIAPSRFLADALVDCCFPAEMVHVCPCGVDTDWFSPGAPEPGRLVMVGRLVEKKAPHLAIAAFAGIAAQVPGAVLEVVGEGPLREVCDTVVAEAGLQERVRFHGALSHDAVRELMKSSDVFVQHSVTAENGDTEGLPVAILEAMSCGLPIVSTRHSGIPEAVVECETGLLVEEHDVEGMASAMATLLTDRKMRQRFGDAGRARAVEVYSLDRTIATLQGILGLPAQRA